MTLVMDGVFGSRGVRLAQRRNTDGGCMGIDAVGGGYEVRVRVVIDVVLQRVHGWVANGRSFAPRTRVCTIWGRLNYALRVALKRGLRQRRSSAASKVRGRRVVNAAGRILGYTVAGHQRRSEAVNGGRGLVACKRVELQYGGDGYRNMGN